METEVVTISPAASIRELVDVLRRFAISGVPVVDEDRRVVGTVSTTDLIWRGHWFAPGSGYLEEDRGARGLDEGKVHDVMTPRSEVVIHSCS